MSTTSLSKPATIASWIAQAVVIVILGMAGFMKVSGAADSRALFEALGAEPWGRYLVGLTELLAAGLMLRAATAARGGLLAMGLMVGAMGTHLFKIGVNYNGDGGSLFMMAVLVFVAGLTVVALRRNDLPFGSRPGPSPA